MYSQAPWSSKDGVNTASGSGRLEFRCSRGLEVSRSSERSEAFKSLSIEGAADLVD